MIAQWPCSSDLDHVRDAGDHARGARVRDIVRLLAWQFSKPLLAANLIAAPIDWWLMRDWLNQFDERIALTPAPFLLAGTVVLALATIAGQSLRLPGPIQSTRFATSEAAVLQP